jgi:enamine deaminase RidA (YjgF/YER057c/UK114 family)
MTTPAQRLADLGITLPAPAAAAANYVPYVLHRNMLVIAGQLPIENGEKKFIGRLGENISVDEAKQAARLCGINILAQISAALGGDLSRVERILRLGVFVNSANDFTDQPAVGNGVSDLMVEVFGDAGRHARAAVGVNTLPFGVSVEVDALVALKL